MKKIILLPLMLSLSLIASEPTVIDRAVNEVNIVVTKVKKIASDIATKTSAFGHKTINKTKEFARRGQDLIIDKSLINGLNATLDKKHMEIKYLKKNTKTNVLTMVVYLDGEPKYLGITLKDFKWGYTKDEKFIVLEKINISLNIPWLDYLVKDAIKRYNGYILVPNYLSISSFLETIKPATKTTFKQVVRQPFNLLTYKFDKKYFDIKKFTIKNKTIDADIKLNGSSNMKFKVDSYDVFTSNNRTNIVLKNIKINSTNKPWLKSIIQKWDNSFLFDYDKNFYESLAKTTK
jgi:hypothetical protein